MLNIKQLRYILLAAMVVTMSTAQSTPDASNDIDENPGPLVTLDLPDVTMPGSIIISGTSSTSKELDRLKISIYNLETKQYWSGNLWVNHWSSLEPTGSSNWSYSAQLDAGNYKVVAWAWDTIGNLGNIAAHSFNVTANTTPDSLTPSVDIIAHDQVTAGNVVVYGESRDNAGISRNKLLVYDIHNSRYLTSSSNWVTEWSWFPPSEGTTGDWFEDISFAQAGLYWIVAWTWDSSNNIAQHDAHLLEVLANDMSAPSTDSALEYSRTCECGDDSTTAVTLGDSWTSGLGSVIEAIHGQTVVAEYTYGGKPSNHINTREWVADIELQAPDCVYVVYGVNDFNRLLNPSEVYGPEILNTAELVRAAAPDAQVILLIPAKTGGVGNHGPYPWAWYEAEGISSAIQADIKYFNIGTVVAPYEPSDPDWRDISHITLTAFRKYVAELRLALCL